MLPPTWSESILEHGSAYSDSDPSVDSAMINNRSGRKSLKFILALNLGWLGLQPIFTVFFGSGRFYLASLGFSDVLISWTWLSGPIAGMLFQPFIGVISDNCYYSWGRRRPFIVVGTAVLICAMLSTAWAEEITTTVVGAPEGWDGINHKHRGVLPWRLFIPVNGSILAANFAIQPVQMGLRTLVIDVVPTDQQGQAHAWIARLSQAGNIVGYAVGSTDLTKNLSFLGRKQLQILCSLVSINLAVCIAVTCYNVHEKRPKKPDFANKAPFSKEKFFYLLEEFKMMEVPRTVCTAQLFCWMAWFPFLYYIATYIGGLQHRTMDSTTTDSALLEADLARTGSFAMLIFALASFTMTIILPQFVEGFNSSKARNRPEKQWGLSYSMRSLCSFRRVWLACQAIFFVCMMSTFFIDGIGSAYLMIAIVGIPWAGGAWIPFTLITRDICKPQDKLPTEFERHDCENLGATVIGIHNFALSAPQVVAALLSSFFFFMADSREPDLAGNGLEVWLLRAGGLAALAATWFISKLPDEEQEE